MSGDTVHMLASAFALSLIIVGTAFLISSWSQP